MKVHIIKPGLDDYCLTTEDKSTYGGLSEIKGVYDILFNNGYCVTVGNDFDNPDVLIVYNSICDDKNILNKIKKFKGRKVQIVTDLNLQYSKEQIGDYIISSQSPLLENYFPYNMFCLKYSNKLKSFLRTKKFLFGYAGGTRAGKRDNYYRKYLINNNPPFISWIHTSSIIFNKQNPNILPKIPYNQLQKKYRDTKFSLVIADDNYNDINFLTQRPFELLTNGVIPFVDINYDKNNMIEFPEILRVKNSEDISNKILSWLANNEEYYDVVTQCEQLLNKSLKIINLKEMEILLCKIILERC